MTGDEPVIVKCMASTPTREPARRAVLGLAGSAAVAALAACSSSPHTPRRTTSSTTAPTPTATPSPTPTRAGRPLTGGPVLAAKIDHTAGSYPRAGIASADVVYVEPVEAGLTRLLAIFSTSMPSVIGPVRSGRESDVDLLASYGPVAFAFSGGSGYTMAILARGKQVNLADGAGFYRDHNRWAPYNLMGQPAALLHRAGGSVRPHDPGFRYAPTLTPGGAPATRVATAWQRARMELAWDARSGRYHPRIDGLPETDALTGRVVGVATVVVQTVRTSLSQNRDVNGVQTPVVHVIGQGPAVVLRSGKVWRGTWNRPSVTTPTTWRDTAGAEILMAPGPLWVLLVPAGQAVTVT